MNEQAQQALALAGEVRLKRLAFLRGIGELPTSEGRIAVAAWLAAYKDDQVFAKMEVAKLLKAIRRSGDARVHRLCQRAQVAPYRTMRSLTARQRYALAAAVCAATLGWEAVELPDRDYAIPA